MFSLSPAVMLALLLLGSAIAPPNLLTDSDGDGDPDYAYVLDWDGDGTLEMQDIQKAMNALTDSGPKLITVGAGVFLPPVASAGQGILKLRSNTTLLGESRTKSVLRGFPTSNTNSPQAVVANVAPAQNVTIRRLTIDGNWFGGDGSFGHHREGIHFRECDHCRVEQVDVRDTLHSCIYERNSSDVVIDDNHLTRCGNYSGSGAFYPCVYLFAEDGLTSENVRVTNNYCENSGAPAYNTRTDGASTLRDVVFSNNFATTTRINEAGFAEGCIYAGWVDNARFSDNVCVDTGSLWSYRTNDLLFERIEMDGVIGTHALQLRGSNGLHVRDLQVQNVDGSAIVLAPPDKGTVDHTSLIVENSSFSEVGEWGVLFTPGMVLDDVAFSRNEFLGLGFGGLYFPLGVGETSSGLVLEKNVIRDFARSFPGESGYAYGIFVTGDGEEVEISGNILEDVAQRAWAGVHYDLPQQPPDASMLCSNDFEGTFTASTEFSVPGTGTTYLADNDSDLSVEACDCNESMATVHPRATEINDAIDNNCPGDAGYGLIDETSEHSGFFDPASPRRYIWPAQPLAQQYEVTRESLSGCSIWSTTELFLDDLELPAPAELFRYLNRALSPNAGSWGASSEAVQRKVICP